MCPKKSGIFLYFFILVFSFSLSNKVFAGFLHVIDDRSTDACGEGLALIGKSISADRSPESKKQSVVLSKTLPGLYGGKRFLIERIRKSWLSSAGKHPRAPQGDPRWFVNVLGVETAKFFGFEIIDDSKMIIPDEKEFIGALKVLNQKLQSLGLQPIALSFYPTPPGTSEVGPTIYVNQFVENAAIPISSTFGLSMLHDLSHHSLSITLPTEIIDIAQEQTKLLLQFIDFVGKNGSQLFSPEEIRHLVKGLKMRRLYEIDSFTANLGAYVVMYAHAKDIRQFEIYLSDLLTLIYRGEAPAKSLYSFDDFKMPAGAENSIRSWKRTHKIFGIPFKKSVDMYYLTKLQKRSMPLQFDFFQQPFVAALRKSQKSVSEMELCAGIQNRIKEIQIAASK